MRNPSRVSVLAGIAALGLFSATFTPAFALGVQSSAESVDNKGSLPEGATVTSDGGILLPDPTDIPWDSEDPDWTWGNDATDTSDRIYQLIIDSAEAGVYSTQEIDHDARVVKVYSKREFSPILTQQIEKVAGEIPVEFLTGSVLSSEEITELLIQLPDEIDLNLIGEIGPNAANTRMDVTVWEASDQQETARKLQEFFSPLEVAVTFAPNSENSRGEVLFANRMEDTSLFTRGSLL